MPVETIEMCLGSVSPLLREIRGIQKEQHKFKGFGERNWRGRLERELRVMVFATIYVQKSYNKFHTRAMMKAYFRLNNHWLNFQ